MDYWQSVLNEARNRHAFSHQEIIKPIVKRDLRYYYLHDAYPHIYFTKREAQCVFWLMHGFTITEAAYKMFLSPRTIEFYVKNMKAKLNCDSKKVLLEKIKGTQLIAQLKSEGMCVQMH